MDKLEVNIFFLVVKASEFVGLIHRYSSESFGMTSHICSSAPLSPSDGISFLQLHRRRKYKITIKIKNRQKYSQLSPTFMACKVFHSHAEDNRVNDIPHFYMNMLASMLVLCKLLHIMIFAHTDILTQGSKPLAHIV